MDKKIGKKRMSTLGLTVPKTPQLLAKTRKRPINALSYDENLEKCLKEELEAKKAEVKAREAEKIRLSKPTSRRSLAIKPSTVAQPFQLSSTNSRKPQTNTISTPPTFVAHPLPAKILKGVTGLPGKKTAPVVIPESPAFATKHRGPLRKAAAITTKPEIIHLPKPRPAPHHGVPAILPPVSKTKTVLEPFSFDKRDKDMVKNKTEKINKIIQDENALREFHAAPIKQNLGLPEKKTAPPTKPQPFHHNIEERVEPRLARWTASVEQKFQEEQKEREFKANEATVLQKKAFIPEPSSKPLAEVQNFTLHSEQRAVEREGWTMNKADKEAKLQAAVRERDARRKLEEDKELVIMRKERVHKAKPIKSYKKPPTMEARPVTIPESPAFSTRQRAPCRSTSH